MNQNDNMRQNDSNDLNDRNNCENQTIADTLMSKTEESEVKSVEIDDKIYTLRKEINVLQKQLEEKKKMLFLEKILLLVDMKDDELDRSNISNIHIKFDKNNWNIKYDCLCKRYDQDNYNMPNTYDTLMGKVIEIDNETISNEEVNQSETDKGRIMNFSVSFGFKKKYYLVCSNKRDSENVDETVINTNKIFKIYRNSEDKLRIINKNYMAELDFSEQSYLINRYANNDQIPEWFAIRVIQFLQKHKWNDEDLAKYLSKI